jgi:hypothetical protein
LLIIIVYKVLTSRHQSRSGMRSHHMVVRVDMWMVMMRMCMRMAVAVVVVRCCHVAVMWHSNLEEKSFLMENGGNFDTSLSKKFLREITSTNKGKKSHFFVAGFLGSRQRPKEGGKSKEFVVSGYFFADLLLH